MAKPQKKTFDDVKMLIATLSITMTLVFWHLFSASAASAQEQVAVANVPQTGVSLDPAASQENPTPAFTGKIMLGGQAPQQQVVVIQRAKPAGNNNANNNNNGGGGGGNVVTQTKSS